MLRILYLTHQRWRTLPLLGKLLMPIVGLMTLSLIVSVFAFFFWTNRTRVQLLDQENLGDVARVTASLQQRTDSVVTAARLLSQDPGLIQALRTHSADAINSRAVVVRDRFSLDLLQIYTATEAARGNLLTSNLYQVSSVLPLVKEAEGPVIRVVANRLLLLMRSPVPDGLGTVIAGLDLETELQRIITLEHLPVTLSLCSDDICVTTAGAKSNTDQLHLFEQSLNLGDRTVLLTVARPTTDMRRVTDVGFLVLLVSSLGTSLLVILAAAAVVRSITLPVRRLAESARAVADGDWSYLADIERYAGSCSEHASSDEIGQLARAFRTMLLELRQLYAELERKVEQRTHDLAATKERYRRLFEEALTGHFIATAEGTVTACNPAFAAMFGFDSPTAAVGCDLCSLHTDPTECRVSLELVATDGRLDSYEVEMRSADGRPVHVILNMMAAYDGDRLVEIRGYLFDITERKRLEDQLRQAQKMEAIGRLAGGVAHDFNNMLTVIIGYSELLAARLGLPPDDPMRKQIEAIHTTAGRAATLTRQLLAFSRKQVLQPRVIDLNDVVNHVNAMLCRLVGEDIQLETVLAAQPTWVRADASQIEQVIMNLCVNARDAMPNGGTLTVKTAHVMLRPAFLAPEAPGGTYAMLSVADTGTGMSPDVLDHIFEPFFTTKEAGKGTGLGLSTVYGIVEQSGGYIRVKSEVGRGSVFRIYLPLVEPDTPPESGDGCSADDNVQGSCATILLVEDEEVVRRFAADVLRDAGYKVLEASCGEDALRIEREHNRPINLLLTDVVMPQMSGRDLAAAIAPLRPTIKVLYMSGYTDRALTHQGVLDPHTAFLSKPFTANALLRKVRAVLSDDRSSDNGRQLPTPDALTLSSN
jgi:PAS domain S-box-containing protein